MGAAISYGAAAIVRKATGPHGPAVGQAEQPERAQVLRHPKPVAIVGSMLAVVAFLSYSRIADRLIAAFMALVLAVVAATDIQWRIIPNRVVLPAIAVALIARIAVFPDRSIEWLLAALGAGMFFVLPNLINSSAMGMGDVKLAVFLGAGLGLGVVGALLVALATSFPVALGMLVRGGRAARGAALPFGPFLAFGGLVILIVPRLVELGGG